MIKNSDANIASIYARHSLKATGYLAFKYVPRFIRKYVKGNKALDYGCGSGRSTRFLHDLNLDIMGVDINENMIREAKNSDADNIYSVIESATIPARSKTFNIVFSSLVLFEISTKQELLLVFNEIHRVLKDDGVFIAITGSTEMYQHRWLTLDANFPENKDLKSGSLAKILLKEVGLELHDYFWTNHDYNEIIQKSRFNLLEKHYPLGEEKDGYPWISEKNVSPYVTYILNKK